MTQRVRVLLLFGGRSAEHDVSRVKRGRCRRGPRPRALRDRSGRDHEGGPLALAGERRVRRNLEGARRRAAGSVPCRRHAGHRGAGSGATCPRGARPARTRRVFPPSSTSCCRILHGPDGEDGTVQGMLERSPGAVRRLGCHRLCGRDGGRRAMAKPCWSQAHRPTGVAHDAPTRPDDVDPSVSKRLDRRLGSAVLRKPASMGSSIGGPGHRIAQELR